MKQKLFGIVLIVIGLANLVWIATVVLLTKGMLGLIYGVIPLVAGWLIFNAASSKESPNGTEKKAGWMDEMKSGFGRIRSFLKGLL
jgi:hypothetical protein